MPQMSVGGLQILFSVPKCSKQEIATVQETYLAGNNCGVLHVEIITCLYC